MPGPSVEEAGVLGVGHADARVVLHVADVAPDGRGGSAGAGRGDDPGGLGVPLQPQLLVDGLGDVVVATPVGGAFGIGELVHVVPAGLGREGRRLLVQPAGVVDEVALATVEFDQAALLGAGGAGHHRDERHADQLREVRLRDSRRAAGCLDDRLAAADPPVAEPVEEERAGEPVLEAARRVRRLVLEVEVDAPVFRQRKAQEMGVRRTVGVRLDLAHRLLEPAPVVRIAPVDVHGLHDTTARCVLTGVHQRSPSGDGSAAWGPRYSPHLHKRLL